MAGGKRRPWHGGAPGRRRDHPGAVFLSAFITDFADAGVVLPIAAAILILLLAWGERRRAVYWALTVGSVLTSILILKLTLAGCTPPSPLAMLRSPSGHTASAAMVYGALAAVLGFGMLPTVAQATGIAALIGASRVLLIRHSPTEAIFGGGIGVIGATAFAALSRRAAPHAPRRTPSVLLPLAAIGIALLLHGTHLNAERVIDDVSARHWPLRACRTS